MKRKITPTGSSNLSNKKQELGGTPEKEKEDPLKSSGHIPTEKIDTDKLNDQTELWITTIDVGQGESTLIRYRQKKSGGKWIDQYVILVDGGRAHFAKKTIIPTLHELGVKKIDAMVCSHYDADHMEGLTALAETYAPDVVYERSLKVRGEDDKVKNFRTAYKGKNKTIDEKDVIKIEKSSPELSIECVSVHHTGTLWKDENDYSIGLLLKFGGFSFFLGGDLTSGIEDDYLKFDHVCAFKCGHHGSKHSTSTKFLDKITPGAAFISASSHSYCHPDDETIARLCHAKSTVQKIYLTNCVYNRAGINSDFENKEKTLVENTYSKITEWLKTNEKLMKKPPKGFKDIVGLKSKTEFGVLLGKAKLTIKGSDISEIFPSDDITDKKGRKCWNELGSLYFAAHDMFTNLDERKKRASKGIVAATPNYLGNIHLIVSGANAAKGHCTFNVFYTKGEAIEMLAHKFKEEPTVGMFDRDDVKVVKRHKAYKHIPSFSMITGPSGEERKNLTPDEVSYLADLIGDLVDSVEQSENSDFLKAVERVLSDTPQKVYKNKDLNDLIDEFIDDYDEALDLYNKLMQEGDYNPKSPAAEVLKALKEARKGDKSEEDDSDFEDT